MCLVSNFLIYPPITMSFRFNIFPGMLLGFFLYKVIRRNLYIVAATATAVATVVFKVIESKRIMP